MNSPKSGSSHYTFRKSRCCPITIPKHEPIKKIYVEMVKEIVEREETNNENIRWIYGFACSYSPGTTVFDIRAETIFENPAIHFRFTSKFRFKKTNPSILAKPI